MYLLTAFSLNMIELPAYVRFQEVSEDDVKFHLQQMKFISAAAHESTAELLSERLGVEIQFNRIDIQLKHGDEAFIAQFPRPKEGQVYSEEEIRDLSLKFVHVYVK